MPKTKPPYPTEFRRQMVELAMAGRTPAELSREFARSAQTITNWVARAAADRGKPLPGKDVLSIAEREELTWLRRQVRQLQMERDILGKATAWFAGRADKTDHVSISHTARSCKLQLYGGSRCEKAEFSSGSTQSALQNSFDPNE